ncbi:MAG: TspO/MBR family protein [Minisyncoccia bacterium]
MQKKYPYYYAVPFYLIVNFIAGYAITFFVDIKMVYSTLVLPSWAPATALFGIVWTVNNVLVLIGNIWTLNAPASSERTMLIRLQIASWINYLLFQWLSFGTGIPALFFFPALSMLLLTIASMYYAYRIDTKNSSFFTTVISLKSITCTFLTLLVWLCIASALGYFVMMHN